MKPNLFSILGGSTLAIVVAVVCCYTTMPTSLSAIRPRHISNPEAEEMDPSLRAEWELQRLRDPRTGRIPEDIRRKEMAFAQTLPGSVGRSYLAKGAAAERAWNQLGPNDVGGRTRALGIDVADERVMIAGGITGGIWRSTDGGLNWNRMTLPTQMPSVTCLVQDTRQGHTRTWYYGTGEFRTNSTRFGNVLYPGDGIFKSTDNGATWHQLTSTVVGTPQRPNRPFHFVNAVVVDTNDKVGDLLYAAVMGGVMRSTDGGGTWAQVLDVGAGVGFTDLTLGSDKALYAVAGTGGTRHGIFRSTNGVDWTDITPAGWGDSTRRIVLGAAPSKPGLLYVLAETPGRGKRVPGSYGFDEYYSLWSYTYGSGNGAGANGAWEDRSDNLPEIEEPWIYNGLNSYAMFVRVKPNDPNTVYLGGSSLWVSTDGFSTNQNYHWMGGYDQDWTWQGVNLLHPDNHTLVFSRSNPNRIYAGNDGGIWTTTVDASFNGRDWSALNINYISTQFYSVALDHSPTSLQLVIGGAQDNGSFQADRAGAHPPFKSLWGGDGSFCAVADGGRDLYISSQYGNLVHMLYEPGLGQTYAGYLYPPDTVKTLFVTPFVLDPVGNAEIFMAAEGGVLRNNRIGDFDAYNWWWRMTKTADKSISVSALGMSASEPAHRLYYGTTDGRLFRVDEARYDDEIPVEITGAIFPKGAYINCVAVDPADAGHVVVVFSNYGVQSIFATSDAGATWQSIAGNLEEQPDGSGSGPSCRWVSMLHVGSGTIYFVGTSTGLYSTSRLDGASTVWSQEGASSIGNVIVDMIDCRQSSGTVAVATWGLGLFSTDITSLGAVPLTAGAADGRMLIGNYPNPVHDATTIDVNIPEGASGRQVEIGLFDELGHPVATLFSGRLGAGRHKLPFSVDRSPVGALPAGRYYYRLSAGGLTDTRAMTVLR